MKRQAFLASVIVLATTFSTGCRSNPVPRSTAVVQTYARTELYFGFARKGAPEVTFRQWQSFVDAEVTPRFPDGLTVLPANGQWKGEDGTIVRETARVLILFYPPQSDADARIEEIRQRYKQLFAQEAVLRADSVERVSF